MQAINKWNLSPQLHAQAMLSDLGKDLIDYERDRKLERPNILYFYLINAVGKEKLPTINEAAIDLARKCGAAESILDLAQKARNYAFSTGHLNSAPTLKEGILKLYERIEQRLGYSIIPPRR